MKRTPVKSSNIKAVGYDSASRVLEVEFSTNAVYSYADVAPSVALQFRKAKSIGNYFATHIKNKHTAVIINEAN